MSETNPTSTIETNSSDDNINNDLQQESPIIRGITIKQIIIVIFSIVIVLSLAGIYYYSQYKNNDLQSLQLSSNQEKITPKVNITSPEINEGRKGNTDTNSDWDTYSNEVYHFSMQYPSGWEIRTCKNTGILNENGFFLCPDNFTSLLQDDLFTISFISPITTSETGVRMDQSLKLTVSKNISTPSPTINPDPNKPTTYQGSPSKIVNLPAVEIGGVTSEKYSASGPGSVTIYVRTINNSMEYLFEMDKIYWDENEDKKRNEIYDIMLDSLHFL